MWSKVLTSLALIATLSLLVVDAVGRSLDEAIFTLLIAAGCFYLALVVHELGHAAAGLLRGMRLVWIVVCTRKLVKVGGAWTLVRLSREQAELGSTVCLPRRPDYSARDEAWLCAGGPLASLLTAALGFTFAAAIREPGSFSMTEAALFGSGAWSAMFAFTSLIPAGSAELPRSDGQRLLDLRRDTADARATLAILRWSGMLAEGGRPADVPEETIAAATAAQSATLRVVARVLEAEARYDSGRRDEALAIARRLTERWEQLPPKVRYTAAGLAAWTHALVARDGPEARGWLEHYAAPSIEPHRRALVEAAVLCAEAQADAAHAALERAAELRTTATWPVSKGDISMHAEIRRKVDALEAHAFTPD